MRHAPKNRGSIWLAGMGLLGLLIVVGLMLWLMSTMITGGSDAKGTNVYKSALDRAKQVKQNEENRAQHLLDNAAGQPAAPTAAPVVPSAVPTAAPTPAPTATPTATPTAAPRVTPTAAPTPSPTPGSKSAGRGIRVPGQAADHGAGDMIKEMEKQ